MELLGAECISMSQWDTFIYMPCLPNPTNDDSADDCTAFGSILECSSFLWRVEKLYPSVRIASALAVLILALEVLDQSRYTCLRTFLMGLASLSEFMRHLGFYTG